VIAYSAPITNTASVPTGWLLCDGSSVSQTTYAALYAAIGNTYGSATSGNFLLPDYRGYFLRGLDRGVGRDPDANARTASIAGANSGDNVGSAQTGAIQSHSHGIADPGHIHGPGNSGPGPANFVGDGCGSGAWRTSMPGTTTGWLFCETTTTSTAYTGISVDNFGWSETRPLNIAVNYLIKY
jgi:hypothetical protein